MWSLPRYETSYTQAAAIQFCDELELAGYSDWRLPKIEELTTLIRGCVDGQATGDFSRSTCTIGDSCLASSCIDDPHCESCGLNGGPGRWNIYAPEDFYAVEDDGEVAYLWSSSPVSDDETRGWLLYLNTVIFYRYPIDFNESAACVRESGAK